MRTLILGAGAAGMFCAAHAGPEVLLVDHAKAPGEKIRISGGGRCNFTNIHTGPAAFLSQNRHFAKSALSRYAPQDFIDLIKAHGIAWHEKTLGQLFCDGKATQIVEMLRDMVTANGAQMWLRTEVVEVARAAGGFRAILRREGRETSVTAQNLVVATGGKSIPKMGATGLAYRIAQDFGLPIVPPRPGLVPFTFADGRFAPLSGVSLPVRATANGTDFAEAMLFTHRGLSGPAILQASSYWSEASDIEIDLLPGTDLCRALSDKRQGDGRKALKTHLATHLPGRLVDHLAEDPAWSALLTAPLAQVSDQQLAALAAHLRHWHLRPTGTEGYRTAEVTLGGVDTDALSSKTMEARKVPGAYFIGECVDVTGWLGGYNFQWAWASAHAAATAIAPDQIIRT